MNKGLINYTKLHETLRICLVGTGFVPISPYVSGSTEKAIYYIGINLAKLGHKVYLLLKSRRELPKTSLPEKSLIHLFNGVYSSILALARQYSLSTSEKIDIIHAFNQFTGLTMKKFAKIKSIPFVYSVSNHWLLEPKTVHKIMFAGDIDIIRSADRVIVLTEICKSKLVKYYGVDPDKISVIPEGIDTSLARDYDYPSQHEEGIILNVGKIGRRKNQLFLVKVLKNLVQREGKRDVKLILVGPISDYDYLSSLKSYILRHGLRRNVIITGEVSLSRLLYFYKRATIFEFPSLLETQGDVVFEAASFGIPVVASKLEYALSWPEELRENIILVDPYDEKKWLNITILLLEDKKLRVKLSSKLKECAAKFDWSIIAGKIASVYREAVSA